MFTTLAIRPPRREMDKHFHDLPLHVLVYPEEERIVAHALEMDVLGYGNTQEEACKNLQDAVEAQLSFAVTSKAPELVSFRAPEEFFERWEKAQAGALRNVVTGDVATTLETKAVFMEITAAMQEEARRGSGAFVEEPELA
jgi:hypothetical protein